MTKIKILVDAHVFDKSMQGTATYIKGLYGALIEYECFEITLCGYDIVNLKKHFTNERFQFVQLKTNSSFKRLLFELPQIIRKGHYDYAHFQYIVPFIKKCKFINTIHDLLFLDFREYFPWSYRFIKGTLFRFSAYRSDIILTVSEYSKKNICSKFGIQPIDIFVTPNAVCVPDHQYIDIKKKFGLNKYILFVSRFEPRKNQIGLLKAYINLSLYQQDYDLVFVGNKKASIELNAYKKLTEQIPKFLNNRIKIMEDVTMNDLFSLYENASCFVFPSFAEGFGIPPIEAAMSNCKVLCSDRTAMQDFTFFNYTFDPNNQEEFEMKLSLILMDNNYPYETIKQKINVKYNWNAIAKDFKNVIYENFEN